MKRLLFIFFVLFFVSCTSPENAQRVLEQSGYTNIKITGFRFFGCGQDDVFRTGFTAVGPSGKNIEGVVCGDFIKASTIRVD